MNSVCLCIAACIAFASAIPMNVNVRAISRTSVSISWRQEYTPELKGFTIHYHNGDERTTEWKTKTIWDARASETIIDGLRPEGEYSFCVRSIMTGKVCACSEQVHIQIASGSVITGEHQRDRYDQQQEGGQLQNGNRPTSSDIQLLEVGAVGGDYVQLRWRYDGPKPAKYTVSYRGYHRYETHDGRWDEQEVDVGVPVELDVEHYVVQNLRPDTTYTFEVTVVDTITGRPVTRPQSIQITTKSYIL